MSEKAKWWEGRRALDSQVEVSVKENLVGRIVQHSQRNLFFWSNIFQRLLKEMEELLGCWRSLLLPLSSDAELSKQAQHLCSSLSAKGVKVDEGVLKVCLSFLFSFELVGSSNKLHSVKLVTRVRSLCCLHRLCSLKKISEDLPWEFLRSGTLSVTIFCTQL